MIAANNTHNGFNLYSLPHGTPIGHFIERDLHTTVASDFLGSDRLLVYGSAGVLKLWDILSKSSLTPLSDTGGPFHASLIPLILTHDPKTMINRGYSQLRWINYRLSKPWT